MDFENDGEMKGEMRKKVAISTTVPLYIYNWCRQHHVKVPELIAKGFKEMTSPSKQREQVDELTKKIEFLASRLGKVQGELWEMQKENTFNGGNDEHKNQE